MKERSVYADHNATTPLCQKAREEMLVAMDHWGNPSSTHRLGRKASELLEKWRHQVAQAAGVEAQEVVFTSGGAESNGMVLMGSRLNKPENFKLLTSSVEHSSITSALPLLKQLGTEMATIKLLPSGALDEAAFLEQIEQFRPDLVSLMVANNETGVIFPTNRIAEICRKAGILFHADATQALGKLDSETWNQADFISLSAHKIYGPKGAGALIVRGDNSLICTRFGGSQETKRRGGTQNMVGVAGFAGACSVLHETDLDKLCEKRDRFEKVVCEQINGAAVQGSDAPRLPNTTNIRFPGIASEVLLSALDLDGMCVSAGSACSSGSVTPSHVLIAMGMTTETAREAIRVSWGRTTTDEDIHSAIELVTHHVKRIQERHDQRSKATLAQ